MNLTLHLLAWMILLVLPASFQAGRTPTPTTTGNQVTITSPTSGAALRGDISITGSTFLDDFQSAVLTFAYSHDPTNTWFFIGENSQPITNGVLTHWDTTTLTDGEYTLRVTVTTTDGKQIIATIMGLRIRNYTPIETDTPTPIPPETYTPTPVPPTTTPLPGDTAIPTITLTPTITQRPPTLTPLPSNPIQLSRQEILDSFIKGGLIVVGIFALGGIIQLSKGISDRRRGKEKNIE